jgi:hypothetical protein
VEGPPPAPVVKHCGENTVVTGGDRDAGAPLRPGTQDGPAGACPDRAGRRRGSARAAGIRFRHGPAARAGPRPGPRRLDLGRGRWPAAFADIASARPGPPGVGLFHRPGRAVHPGRLAGRPAGPADVSSDEFELRLGLLQTAQREWADTPRSSPAGQAQTGFSRGVNDYLAQVRASGDWPAVFSLPRVYPGPWTPVDSLVIQGVLTQELDFTTTPLDYALLDRSLGPARGCPSRPGRSALMRCWRRGPCTTRRTRPSPRRAPDRAPDWWAGRYLPMPPAGGYSSGTGRRSGGTVRWALRP